MPNHRTEAVGQPCGACSSQQATVNGGRVCWVSRVALMLIDTAAAHGSIEEANRDLVGFDQVAAQFHGPIAHLMAFVVPPSMDGRAPGSDLSGFIPHAAEGSDPIAPEVRFVRAPIRGNRIGLSIDEVGVSARDIRG